MRLAIVLLLIFLAAPAATAQYKPTIIGQKELSTNQDKPITIQLTDLYVQETDDSEGNPGNGNGNGNGNGGNNGGGNHDNDDDDDDGSDDDDNGHGDNGGDEDGEDWDNDDDDHNGGGDPDSGGGKDDDDDDNDNDGGKGGDGKGKDKDKDKGKDKGKGKDHDDDHDKDKDKDKDKGEDKDKDKDRDDRKDKDKGKGKNKGGNSRTSYPEGYVLELFQGSNFTFSGTTVTPSSSFTGTLTVPVRVKNARHASPVYDLKIQVNAAPPPQNVAPVITGQSALRTTMNQTLEVKFSDVQVTDPDDKYPEGFLLKLLDGENYDITDGRVVRPATGFSGNLAVPVVVNDGKSDSQPFNLVVSVTAPTTPANVAPKITGQLPISISVNQSVRIIATHLLVTDPDNDYPEDFALKVLPGNSYTLENTTVIPPENFVGTITVKVSVNDGVAESAPFNLQISVNGAANKKPVITGQVGIRIRQGESLLVKPSHLVVNDEDDTYPDGFSLSVHPGKNFSVSDKTITPAPGFLGTLNIPVTVHDGETASDSFILQVEVVPRDKLAIVGQGNLEMLEDSVLALKLQDLLVNDPQGRYPDGFTLNIGPGANYAVDGDLIRPARDFFGNLTVPVTVTQAGARSEAFHLLIVVNGVNDAPELLNVSEDPILVAPGSPFLLFDETDVVDVDDEHLLFAEVAIRDGYVRGDDRIEYDASDSLHVIFDEESGTLFMVGRASLALYQDLIRSLRYTGTNLSDSLSGNGSKIVTIELNDGKRTSVRYDRLLRFDTDIPLEIPTAFTPNNDNANDTWRIAAVGTTELTHATIRVYDKKGIVVFESNALENEWDGHFNGSPLPADVYYYTIELDLSYRKVNFKGIVAILR